MAIKPAERTLPFDLEIEQALLGALLIDEKNFWTISDRLFDHDFYDPLHQRIFDVVARLNNHGGRASPLTVKSALDGDASFAEVGGQTYLVSLARAAPAVPNVRDYARILRNLAQRRALIAIGEDLVAAAYENAADFDPVAMGDDASNALYDATHGEEAGDGPQSIHDLAYKAAQQAEEAHNNPRGVWLTSGLHTVDEGIGGIYRGDVLVLGAPPSMGKTALIQLIAEANASGLAPETGRCDDEAANGVLFFSLEMSGVSVATRYISQKSQVPSDRIRRGKTSSQDMAAIAEAPHAFEKMGRHYEIDSTPNLSVAQMRARALSFRRKNRRLAMLIIDHLQFVQPADRRSDEKESAKQITRDLCALAKELNVAIVLISHLTKENERRASQRPQMGDLYGSAAIAQNADSVWFIYRQHYYLSRQKPDESDQKEYDRWIRDCDRTKGWAEIFSTKVRMGATASVQVRFDERFTRFYDPPTDKVDAQVGLGLIQP